MEIQINFTVEVEIAAEIQAAELTDELAALIEDELRSKIGYELHSTENLRILDTFQEVTEVEVTELGPSYDPVNEWACSFRAVEG